MLEAVVESPPNYSISSEELDSACLPARCFLLLLLTRIPKGHRRLGLRLGKWARRAFPIRNEGR